MKPCKVTAICSIWSTSLRKSTGVLSPENRWRMSKHFKVLFIFGVVVKPPSPTSPGKTGLLVWIYSYYASILADQIAWNLVFPYNIASYKKTGCGLLALPNWTHLTTSLLQQARLLLPWSTCPPDNHQELSRQHWQCISQQVNQCSLQCCHTQRGEIIIKVLSSLLVSFLWLDPVQIWLLY